MTQLKLDDLSFVEPIDWKSQQLQGGISVAYDADAAAASDVGYEVIHKSGKYTVNTSVAAASAYGVATAVSFTGKAYAHVDVYANASA